MNQWTGDIWFHFIELCIFEANKTVDLINDTEDYNKEFDFYDFWQLSTLFGNFMTKSHLTRRIEKHIARFAMESHVFNLFFLGKN